MFLVFLDLKMASSLTSLYICTHTQILNFGFQARAITEMVQDLFDALKTDPENFESEISKRIRAKKRIKGGAKILNSGCCDQLTSMIASKVGFSS